jgi:hypothetical protein
MINIRLITMVVKVTDLFVTVCSGNRYPSASRGASTAAPKYAA